MTLIIDFSKIIKVQYIELDDESTIMLNTLYISLSMLYILLYNLSWYNKFKLKSDNFENEQTTNIIICNYNFNRFIFEAIKNKVLNETNEKNKEIDYLFDYIFNLDDISIFSTVKLFIIYNKLVKLYKIITDDNIDDILTIINSNDSKKIKIPLMIDKIKQKKIEHDELDIKQKASDQIIIDNNELLSKINTLFDELKKKFVGLRLEERLEEKLEEKLKEKYSEEIPYNIDDDTPIKNIVRIICISGLENYSNDAIEIQLLKYITDLAKYILLYDGHLKLVL